MTSRLRIGHPARLHGGVLAPVLAFLSVVGLLALGTVTASAAELPDAEYRVRVCASKTITAVGVSEHITAGQRRGPPVLQGRFVVATGVAADTEASLAAKALNGFPKAARESPKPEGFDPTTWEWREAARNIPEKHWWDHQGGEWRFHGADKWHDPRWDYNAWTQWNCPWQHIYPDGAAP